MIISVDHGNKSIKTPNALFTSGLISSEGLQGFKTDYICWNGRYYTLTEQRISYLRDKTEDERFYILTDRKSTRLNSSHVRTSRMPSSA